MKESSKLKQIKKEIAEIADERGIHAYLRNNNLYGLLEDKDFSKELVAINPIIRNVLWSLRKT